MSNRIVLILGLSLLSIVMIAGRNPVPSVLSMVIPFCGQGGASSTDHYIGPAIAIGEELVPGNTACDAKDSSTAAGADILPLGMDIGYTVRGMVCQLNSGTNDTVVMTLYDDAAATTVSCIITAAGGIENCRAGLTDVVVAEGSLLAILVDNDDDDLSAQDLLCHVIIDL